VTKENYYCSTCEKYLPSTEFPISTTSTKVGKCRNCKHLENVALKRTDFTKYKYISKYLINQFLKNFINHSIDIYW
jgi:IQ and ubiquitin-like domain-containing protein